MGNPGQHYLVTRWCRIVAVMCLVSVLFVPVPGCSSEESRKASALKRMSDTELVKAFVGGILLIEVRGNQVNLPSGVFELHQEIIRRASSIKPSLDAEMDTLQQLNQAGSSLAALGYPSADRSQLTRAIEVLKKARNTVQSALIKEKNETNRPLLIEKAETLRKLSYPQNAILPSGYYIYNSKNGRAAYLAAYLHAATREDRENPCVVSSKNASDGQVKFSYFSMRDSQDRNTFITKSSFGEEILADYVSISISFTSTSKSAANWARHNTRRSTAFLNLIQIDGTNIHAMPDMIILGTCTNVDNTTQLVPRISVFATISLSDLVRIANGTTLVIAVDDVQLTIDGPGMDVVRAFVGSIP